MNTKITIAVVVAFLIYSLYSWYSIPQYDGFDINQQKYENVMAPPKPVAPTEVISAGGPSSPNAAPPVNEHIMVPPEEPYDPQEQTYESADHPDRLRYPERAYGPGLEQDDMTRPVESGIASNSHQKTMNAYQTFGPEFAQNGGAFMENGVMANDTALNDEYSSV
jgi:hypothetical protein